jgi:predicted ATP-grasp superfamily ATP-dependent carboligase
VTATVLVVGVSVRGLAESAVRAGYRVHAVDAFADLDLLAVAADVRRVSPYTAGAAARLVADVATDAVCYVSNFENHPAAVTRLATDRTLWGNPARTLRCARNAAKLPLALQWAGLPAASVRPQAPRIGTRDASRHWLIKRRASGGGRHVAPWSPGVRVPRSSFLQERQAGQSGSILFVADGTRAVVFGITRQVIGDRHFGGHGFRYCGNMLAPPDDPLWGLGSELAARSAAIANAVTSAFGLVGVNGVDVIVGRRHVVPIEINPRYTAAMELVERRDGLSVFGAHVAGCTQQIDALQRPTPGLLAVGKAVVFARRATVTPAATRRWLEDPDVRDVPPPETRIAAGSPICTIFAAAPTTTECYASLVERAKRVYGAVPHC